jgi:DNA-binding GntR family transcriptional regulator
MRGRIRFTERIEALEEAPVEGPLILPGFLDLHVNGGGGYEVMAGREGVEGTAAFHLRHGTTGLLPTTLTAPLPHLESALLAIQEAMKGPLGEAILGAHLEGPFLNPRRLGAQPPFPLPPDPEVAQRLLSLAPVRVLTLAPELPGALDLIRLLAERGVRVQLGHTAATYQEALAALEAGASGFTHLYNAMTGLHHREPGVVGLALERLAVEGFVETKPRAGSRVKIPTAGEIRGNYIVREALEVEAARLFAQSASAAQRARLVELAARLDARYARLRPARGGADAVRTEQAHVAFHLFIARATRCPELVEAIVRSRVLMFNWLFSRAAFPEPLPADWHARLARVLASGSPEEAEAAMREHVRFRMEEVLKRFARLRRRMATQDGMVRGPRLSAGTR